MARTTGAYSTVSQAPRLQQVWQSMRVMRRFTSADLLVTAEAGESQVHKYCRALAKAGYLKLHVPRVSGRPGSRDVWALVRNSGPTAPIVRADGSGVYDPNTKDVWGPDGNRLAQPDGHRALAEALLAAERGEACAPRDLSDLHLAAQGESHE